MFVPKNYQKMMKNFVDGVQCASAYSVKFLTETINRNKSYVNGIIKVQKTLEEFRLPSLKKLKDNKINQQDYEKFNHTFIKQKEGRKLYVKCTFWALFKTNFQNNLLHESV